jgi:flagellar assembly protein FliH
MSSKLHRGGFTGEAEPWEPLLKNGVQPARGGRESASHGMHPAAAEEDRVRAAERQSEARAQAAYQRGIEEGEAAERQQGAAQVQSALERVARSAAEIASLKPGLRHEAEEDVVKLAIAISRRILYREIATDPEALRGLVRAALDKLDGREVYRVRANPQDAPALEKHFQTMGLPRKIEIFADAALQRGSAAFETAHGSFDASVDTQLVEIERGFADLMRKSP